MSLPEPTIDDRSYEQILDEALARIPVHTPLWTNYNDSDPGVTILQVFAFMVESLQYRANRVPERNRIKFLKLLGMGRRPATAAEGFVTFRSPRGPLQVETLGPDVALTAGSVPFRTQTGLDVLPVEAHLYYKADPELSGDEAAEAEDLYGTLYEALQEPGRALTYYETRRVEAPAAGAPLPEIDLNEDTVDGDQSLWLALLARPGDDLEQARRAIGGAVLSLAVVPALRAEQRASAIGVQEGARRVLLPSGRATGAPANGLVFEVPHVTGGGGASGPARYRELDVLRQDDVLAEPGLVTMRLPETLQTWSAFGPLEAGVGAHPPSLEGTDLAEGLIKWIRIRPRRESASTPSRVRVRLSYVGFNAARVVQQVHVESEFLGQGTGRPDQRVILVNTPVLPGSVDLTVNGEPWTPIDDLAAAPPEVPLLSLYRTAGEAARSEPLEAARVYTLDPASGTIRFGDGLTGARPPRGAIIQARYDYGGGGQGVVGIGAINAGAGLPPALQVTNPVPPCGGAEPETAAEAERRIPGELRRRHRLISASDFVDVTHQTPGVDVGRVEVLPLTHPGDSFVEAAGVVAVLVIPATDPNQPDAPTPDRLFLDAVCAHLDPRRLVTTEVHVVGPTYRRVHVGVGIDVVPGRDLPPVREAVRNAVRGFLSPLTGGFTRQGWPLGRTVWTSEITAVAARAEGVAGVRGVTLGTDTDVESTSEVELRPLELPRLGALGVQPGAAPSLKDLTATIPPDTDGPELVPVPIVPRVC